MSIKIKLQLIDRIAGEAVLSRGREWYLLSIDRDWEAIRLGDLRDVFRWSRSRCPALDPRVYSSIDEASEDVRRLCKEALEQPSIISQSKVRDVLLRHGFRPEAPSIFPENVLGEKAEVEVQETVVAHYYGRLMRLFEQSGANKEEAFYLSMETFNSLFESADLPSDVLALEVRIFDLAQSFSQPFREAEKNDERPSIRRLGQISDESIRSLRELPNEVLRCLALWAEEEATLSDINIVLCKAPSSIRAMLTEAARHLGCTITDLKDPRLRRSCHGLLKAI